MWMEYPGTFYAEVSFIMFAKGKYRYISVLYYNVIFLTL